MPRGKGRRTMRRTRYISATLIVAGTIATTVRTAPAAVWENDPAKLCEIQLLDKEVDLTNRQHEAIKPTIFGSVMPPR